MVCKSRNISESSMIPLAISFISRSRCAMAVSLLPICLCWDVCKRVDCEYDLSASDSMSDGSVYGFCIGVEDRSSGVAMPSIPRSSVEYGQVSMETG